MAKMQHQGRSLFDFYSNRQEKEELVSRFVPSRTKIFLGFEWIFWELRESVYF
jgi:hypothetical protein